MGRAKIQLSIEQIQPFFSYPISEAAKVLKLSKTTLKQRCRELGIDQWPFKRDYSQKRKRVVPSSFVSSISFNRPESVLNTSTSSRKRRVSRELEIDTSESHLSESSSSHSSCISFSSSHIFPSLQFVTSTSFSYDESPKSPSVSASPSSSSQPPSIIDSSCFHNVDERKDETSSSHPLIDSTKTPLSHSICRKKHSSSSRHSNIVSSLLTDAIKLISAMEE
ncbi:hypothetical protein ADUPG1_009844 [Aduncisulcus paluster]|uniref:RWP-RK domain-containing protein n=1 Tax=Aduncisulcus paluster TaxID=2918883 RepID=A0ABQ5KZN8_9EUKA|nr:hypothetical protein ADUPG1_009844 [Aduncisulcus paluster]